MKESKIVLSHGENAGRQDAENSTFHKTKLRNKRKTEPQTEINDTQCWLRSPGLCR